MSAYTTNLMTNHHHSTLRHPVAAAISDLLHTWSERSKRRAELARLTDKDFHDVGASWSDLGVVGRLAQSSTLATDATMARAQPRVNGTS